MEWMHCYRSIKTPGGIPVATAAVDNAKNAGLLAARILGCQDQEILDKMLSYQEGRDDGRKETRKAKGRAKGLENNLLLPKSLWSPVGRAIR